MLSPKGDIMLKKQMDRYISPPKEKNSFLHTAVLKGIAVFFCSTFSPLFLIDTQIHYKILCKSASALWRMRFFYGDIGRTSTFYWPRAPSLQSRSQKSRLEETLKLSFGKSELDRHPFPDARLSLLSLQK